MEPIQELNETWHSVVKGLTDQYMRAHPSTQKVAKYFTSDVVFQDVNEPLIYFTDPLTKETFLKKFKISCEDNILALLSPQTHKIAQVGNNQEGYIRFEIVESIQKRLWSPSDCEELYEEKLVAGEPGLYRVKYAVRFYFTTDDHEVTKICKVVQEFFTVEPISEEEMSLNNCN